MEIGFFKTAAALYTVSMVLSFGYLLSKKERLSFWLWKILSVGLFCHVVSFILRTRTFWQIPENRYFLPINTFFGALSYLALAVALVFWVVEGRHRLNILGAFVLPWACLASGAAVVFADPAISGLVPALQSYWINIHPMVLMTAYAAFANAFGVGLALLIQEHQVKSRKPSLLCYRLPAIEDLDQLNYRIIAVFFPVLTIGIIMGGVWAYNAWGRFWGWDAKETWALITWFVYVIYLHMRFFGGVRGRKTVYVSMLGFASVIFTFVGVNYLSELHGYLSSKG
ncbi:MAG: c-type cytochrome biogenesis protein CcsB [Elusimicrobia bacterium]|nr:c-type cytochrome biogenesis protein CcsB [Elusimicrobiota bacterium]